MRNSKRLLAGIAAGALGASLIPFVAVAAAPAANAASLTAAVTPVRVSFAGTALEQVPYAAIAWTASSTTATSDTATVTLTSAPTPTAQLSIGDIADIGTQVTNSSNSISSGDDTLSLAGTTTGGGRTYVAASGTTAALAVSANTAGTYAGTITANKAGVPTDTVAFSFTTTGKATSMTLTPASQATAVSGTAPLTATLKDASGAVTQPLWVDSVALSVTGTNSFVNVASSTITSLTGSGSTASSLYDGAAIFYFVNGGTGGVYTATATPAGTLSSAGVTAQSASITVSGSVSPTAVAALAVASPDTGDDTGTQPNTGTQVPTGTASIVVSVTGQSSQAGATVYLKGVASAGTPSSSAPAIIPVTLGANYKGTATFTLGGAAAAANAWLQVTQVTAAGAAVSGPSLSVQQKDRVLTYITPTPGGSIVATLGATTTVSVETLDQFLAPVAGATVQARRTSASGTLLSSGVTNASGVASVTVSPQAGLTSGSSETYYFNAIPIGGSQVNGTSAEALTVTYTTGGTTTSMSVAVSSNSGASTPITNTGLAPTLLPLINVPYGGFVDTAGTGVWSTTLDDTVVAVGSGNSVAFVPTPLPGGMVTVTAPEGVKVNVLGPSATRLWSSGSQSITVNSGQTVYVSATKTGVHDIVFKSGDITVTTKIKAVTPAAAAYNIALDPATKTVATSTFDRLTLKVTDVFGNPVPYTTTASGLVTVKATGQILLGGLSTSQNVTTGADGTATVTIIADNDSGEGIVTAEPGVLSNAWAGGYVPPTGATAPVKSAKSVVTVSSASTKSITIAGERTTVSGKPGIMVDGDSTGLAAGATVKPYVRFPGGEYTEGTARPKIGAAGEFEWSRKTGKKTYVFFTNDDGSVQSNRIIIAAN